MDFRVKVNIADEMDGFGFQKSFSLIVTIITNAPSFTLNYTAVKQGVGDAIVRCRML